MVAILVVVADNDESVVLWLFDRILVRVFIEQKVSTKTSVYQIRNIYEDKIEVGVTR